MISLFGRLIGTKPTSSTAGAAAPNPTKFESEHSPSRGTMCSPVLAPRRVAEGQALGR